MSKITLAHGSGGTLMHKLIEEVILSQLHNPILNELQKMGIQFREKTEDIPNS